MALTNVSLTVTPASEANSTETSGLRVDGQDLCWRTPPAGYLVAGQGWLRWDGTSRHDAANLADFAGAANLPYWCLVWGNANNYALVQVTAANTVQLSVTAAGVNATNNWDCTGAIVADTTYLMELRWDGTWFRFIVDGATVAQLNTAAQMAVDTTAVYYGCSATPAHEADMSFSAP